MIGLIEKGREAACRAGGAASEAGGVTDSELGRMVNVGGGRGRSREEDHGNGHLGEGIVEEIELSPEAFGEVAIVVISA